jgi:hypothetical protein
MTALIGLFVLIVVPVLVMILGLALIYLGGWILSCIFGG